MNLVHVRYSFAEAFFPRLSEWSAACMLLALSWMLFVNDALMATGTGRGYALMLSIADQATWAGVMLVFGMARVVVLFINGAWRRSPWARAIMAVLTCFFWAQIALSFLPVFGFSFMFASGFLVMDLINIVRAMRDARIVDDEYARRRRANAA